MALEKMKSKLNQPIVFWIAIFFLIRCIGITNPPLDVAHNWRQTTVTMVARNYFEAGGHFFFPQIDVAGEKTGITGMEFPLLNYLIYLVSKVFGYAHWYGRLINLIISSFGIYYFYLLVKKHIHDSSAFPSAMLLLGSIWFAYSRKIMPDTFAMSILIWGIYQGLEYLKSGKNWKLLFSSIGITLGVLCKLPMIFAIVPLALLWFDKSHPRMRIYAFFGILALAVGLSFLYYFQWVPYLNEKFGFVHFFMGKSIQIGAMEILANWKDVIEKYYLDALHFTGFAAWLVGLLLLWKHKNQQPTLFYTIALATLAFFGIMLKSGTTFAIHSYYIVPFAPVMALVAGYALTFCKTQKIQHILLFIIIAENVLNWQHDFRIKPAYAGFEKLGVHLDSLGANRKDLIFVNSKEVPTTLYFAHRKGWCNHNDWIVAPGRIDSLANLGLKWIVVAKTAFGEPLPSNNLPIIQRFENEHYQIYSLGKYP
jgi:4-amino-4-deoxy-L-arabinose transferase-like glycosyltransferase